MLYKREIIKNRSLNESNLIKPIIRVVQWNIFAQGFVVADNYQFCKPEDLTLENRKKLFKKEFEYINADIYCFQEADIHNELLDVLNQGSKNYLENFVEKKQSACLLYPNNYGPDGCSIAYDKDKYQCLQTSVLDFENGNRCLFSVFCFISNPDIKFIIACTHLKSKKRFHAMRLIQCQNLLSNLEVLMEKWKTAAAFICGDFNASPSEETIKNVKNSSLNFVNIYEELKSESNKIPYTTWSLRKNISSTKRIVSQISCSSNDTIYEKEDIIDYIWYTKSKNFSNNTHKFNILPLSVVDVPSKEEIGHHGLPSNKYPSDHISLIADFIIDN